MAIIQHVAPRSLPHSQVMHSKAADAGPTTDVAVQDVLNGEDGVAGTTTTPKI